MKVSPKAIAEKAVSKQLDLLLQLQSLDSELDGIYEVRGVLPEEIADLDDEIAGINVRIQKIESDVKAVERDIQEKKQARKDANNMIGKYEEQLKNVRNNREFEAIQKELELQQLEIQVLEKRVKEDQLKIEQKQEQISMAKSLMESKEKDLKSKQQELDQLSSEFKDTEKKFLQKRDKIVPQVEDRLYKYYQRLRQHLNNGLAVVKVKNGVPEGGNIVIPPQMVAEIKQRKKIIIDEHSGQILAGVDEIQEEEVEAPKKRRTTRKKTS